VAVLALFGLIAFAASVYLVLVLEILKLRRWREYQLRRAHTLAGEPAPARSEVDAQVEHDLETGEFPAVKPPA
jgi:UDP-GlcNAc:undecaprenyl-phosphate GlcNAc-1-phosphate transferase